ncbi:MAG: hypothetical protein AABO41_05675 [Acidobacteriota bacterium]
MTSRGEFSAINEEHVKNRGRNQTSFLTEARALAMVAILVVGLVAASCSRSSQVRAGTGTDVSLEAGIRAALQPFDIDRPFAWTAGRTAAIDRTGVLRVFTVARKNAGGYALTPSSLLPHCSRGFEQTLSRGPLDFSQVLSDREVAFRIDTIPSEASTVYLISCWYARQRGEEADGLPLLSARLRVVVVRDGGIVASRLVDFDPESPCQIEARDFDGDQVMDLALVSHYVSDTLRIWKVGNDGSLTPLPFLHIGSKDRDSHLSDEAIRIETDGEGDFIRSTSRRFAQLSSETFRWNAKKKAFVVTP